MKGRITGLLMLVSVIAFSQKSFQGKAVYESKTTMNADFGGREMSEERKKRIAERMKGMFEKTYTLHFDKATSTYKEEEKLVAPGQGSGGRFGGMMSSFSAGEKYKNTKEAKLIESKEFFGKKFLITEDIPKPEWELGEETKQIGNYTCFKATMVKKIDEFDWKKMRRRPRRGDKKPKEDKDGAEKTKKITEEIEMPKEIIVTAWYTPQIPVSNGPGDYWGLPGLILEINEGKTTVLCSEITLNPSEKAEIKAPEKGKEVTRKEYNEIVKKKVEEMREMFRGRRGGRGGIGPH